MKRLQTPLRRTMTEGRLSALEIVHIHKHKDVNDIHGIITEFARRKGTHVTVLPFFWRKQSVPLPISLEIDG